MPKLLIQTHLHNHFIHIDHKSYPSTSMVIFPLLCFTQRRIFAFCFTFNCLTNQLALTHLNICYLITPPFVIVHRIRPIQRNQFLSCPCTCFTLHKIFTIPSNILTFMVPIHATLHSLLLVNIKTFITSPVRVNPNFILTRMKQQAESKTHDFLN